MPLPTSREETGTPGAPVHSNRINAIEDAIIAEHAARIGVQTLNFRPLAYANAGTQGGTIFTLGTGGGTYAEFVLPLPTGCRVRQIKTIGRGNAADDIGQITFEKRLGNTTTSLHANVAWNNVPAVDTVLTTDIDESAAASRIADLELVVVIMSLVNGVNVSIHGFAVEIDFAP